MSESIQHKQARRPPRVHITFDVDKDGAIEKKEIPFNVGVMADLSGETKKELLFKRDFEEVAKHNFDKFLKKIDPTINIKVKNMVNIKFDITNNIIDRIDKNLKEDEFDGSIIFTIIDYYIDEYSIAEDEWKLFNEASNKMIDQEETNKDVLKKQLQSLNDTVMYYLPKNDIIAVINDSQNSDSETKNKNVYKDAINLIINEKVFIDDKKNIKDFFTCKNEKELQKEIEQCFSDKKISSSILEKLMEKKRYKIDLSEDEMTNLDPKIKSQLPVNFVLKEKESIEKFYDYIFKPHSYTPNIKQAIKTVIDESAYSAIKVPLSFNKMDDFSPENLIEKVETLKELRKTRDQLASLKGKTDGNYEFTSELNDIIKKSKNLQR